MFQVNDKVIVVAIDPLGENEVAPDLHMGAEHEVKAIVLDSNGNQHLDVGLVSKLNFVRSFETKEELPNGDKIHWCHPSRFKKA